jgi:hypothetical protein
MIQLNISSEAAKCLWLLFLSISPQNTAATVHTARRVYSKTEKLQVRFRGCFRLAAGNSYISLHIRTAGTVLEFDTVQC